MVAMHISPTPSHLLLPPPSTCWMPRLGRPHPEAHGFPRLTLEQLAPGPGSAKWLQGSLPCAPQAELWAVSRSPAPARARPQRRANPAPPGLLSRTLCPLRRSLWGQRR